MAVSLKHSFQSAKADGADSTLVQPSSWNAEHTLTLATNKLLGRSTAGTGAAEEISIGTGLSLSAGTLTATVTYPGAGIPNSTGSAWGTSYTTTGSGTVVALATGPSISAGVFNDGYTEEVATANTGTTYTIDLANGSVQILTLTGNCTFTFPTATAGRSFVLILKQDATGSRTATWPSAVKWPGGTAPTITSTASKSDKYVFTADGTNWIGSTAGQNYTL